MVYEEDTYSNLYDYAPIGYFTFDKNGGIIEVNLTGANLLGTERSFLIKKPFSLYIDFSSRNVFYLHLRKVFRTNTKQICEIKVVDKNKNQFDVQLESLAVQDSKGNFSKCSTAISDITERKKAEKAIFESEERYRSLVESAKDIIAMVSPDGIIISLNPAFEKITGWAREEWFGKSFSPLIHPEDLPMAMEVFQRTLNGETMTSSELRLLANSGDYVHVEYATTPLLKDGKVIGNLNVVRDIAERKRAQEALSKVHDELEIRVKERTGELKAVNKALQAEITEHKLAEEALRESEGRLKSILDNSSTVVFLNDLEGRYITVNRRYEELFHVTRQDAVCKSDHDIFPREHADRFRKHDLLALEKGGPIEIEEVVPLDDGLHVYISVKFPLFNAEGKPYAVYGIATDITERKRAEEALAKAHDESELQVQERTADLKKANVELEIEITERRRAEEQVKEQAGLLDKAHDAIAVRDLEQRIIYWNKGAQRLYGWTAWEILGKNADELLYNLYFGAFSNYDERFIAETNI
jgi:PAS domain S-box-containing protein